MKKIFCVLTILSILAFSSCKKPAGSGGNSTITGKIWVENYNALNSISDIYTFKGEYAGADEDVFIIYGNDISYGDKTKSGTDGVFQFNYLRTGNYKIYVASKDTSRTSVFYGSGIKTISVDATISKKKETVDVGTLLIYK